MQKIFFSNYFEYDDSLLEVCNVSNILDKYGFSRERTSHDIIVNHEGNILLDICKSNNFCIMNGRFGDDKFKGAMTFRNCSVIDYSIVSHQLLKHIQDFSITELDPIFTDEHSLIHTSLKYKTVNTSNNTKLRADMH